MDSLKEATDKAIVKAVKNADIITPEVIAKPEAIVHGSITQRGNFWRRKPSVDLRLTYPDVKMQGIVKNTVIKLKGTAFKVSEGFIKRTCANPITLTNEAMTVLQTAVDTRLGELTKEMSLSGSQVGYINGHMTNHFNDYITVK